MVFFFTFGITALIAIGIFSVSWAILASLFFLPIIILVFGGGLALWGTYYVSRIGYNNHVKPLLIQHVPMYRNYAAKKEYKRMKKEKPDGTSVRFALATAGSNIVDEPAASSGKTNGSSPFSKRAFLKSMGPGRIVSATSDSKNTKKGWWRFVNNVDATVYLTKEEKEEIAERMKEIRRMREKKLRTTSGDDTLSDIENDIADIDASGALTSTPASIRPLSKDVASIIPNAKQASDDEDGDEGWGDGVPPYGYDESGKPIASQTEPEPEGESASSESMKSYD